MGEMRDSDWSRRNLLRSDWLGPRVAMYTTHIIRAKILLIVNIILTDGIRMFLNTLTKKIEANLKITIFVVK